MKSPSWEITNHTTFHSHCTLLCDGSHPVEYASPWIQTKPPLTYCSVSHRNFAMRHQSLSFIRSWSQALWVLAGLKSQSDTTEWLNMAQSPCHVGLSPNLRKTVASTTFRNEKMMTCPIVCKQRHRCREELKEGRKKQWEKCTEESPS